MELFQSMVVSRITGAWELKSDIDRLRDSLPHVNHLMEKAEWWRFNDKYIAHLLKQLVNAAYDAEDLIAEFDYYELKQRMESQAISNSSSKVKEAQTKLDSVCGELESMIKLLGLPDGPNPYGKAVQHETSSLLPDLFLGRDDEVEEVVKLLLQASDGAGAEASNEASSSSLERAQKRRKTGKLSILPIVGMGGMGKTTLAQQIYNDERVKNHFDLTIWVCVSDFFDLKKITREMIESAKRESAAKGEFRNYDKQIGFGESVFSLESLQQMLKEMVASRRYLLVLDDVWHDSARDWESLCNPLRSGLQGSIVLITTRMSTVAEKVGILEPIEIKSLPPDIYWNLFKKCSFGSCDPSSFPELEGISKKIAANMKGSPLAAKTLGGILRASMTIEQWRSILNSELWQIEQAEGDILPALRVSYQYLTLQLKRCFCFLSLFPNSFDYSNDALSTFLVANGIINKEDDNSYKYVKDFKSRSFLVTENGGLFVHDLIHDLAKSVSSGTCYCQDEKPRSVENHKNVRHLSMYRKPTKLIHKEISRCQNLRSLIFLHDIGPKNFPKINMESSTLASLFDQLVYLRVLHLEMCQIEELPHNIGKLKLLIYINLRYTKVRSLPDAICQLYNLQVINVEVEGSEVVSFPKLFHKLINLRQIIDTKEISMRIPGIGKMTSLETLREFKILKEGGHRIKELQNMTRLQGGMRISNLEKVKDERDAAQACLDNKMHLTGLTLTWSPCRSNRSGNEHTSIDQNVIEGLRPHPNLEILYIENYEGRTPPSWLQTEMLPCLNHLCIQGCLNLDSLDDWFMPRQLPSLLTFQLKEFVNLVSLLLEWINNSSITDLTVINCPRLRYSNNLMFPSSLRYLELDSCGEFDMALPGCLMNLNSLYELTLSNCQHVTSLPSQVTHHIEVLKLRNCAELQCLELISNPSILKRLEITKCPKLIQSSPLFPDCEAPSERIQELSYLTIDNTSLLKLPFLRIPPRLLGCMTISNSPEERLFTGDVHGWLNGLEMLQTLEIKNCHNLESLPKELHTLVTLKFMYLRDCPKIQSLPQNGFPPSLAFLGFRGCHPALMEQLMQHEMAVELT